MVPPSGLAVLSRPCFLRHEFANQAVEAMNATLACWRIAAVAVKAGAHAALYRLNHLFVLQLDLVHRAAGASVELRFVPDVSMERNARTVYGLRLHEVQRKPPWIEIQHEVRKYPEIVRCHAATVVR